MNPNPIGHLRRQVLQSAAVAKLQAAAQELIGGALLFVARHGDEVIEIHPLSTAAEMWGSSGETSSPYFARAVIIQNRL